MPARRRRAGGRRAAGLAALALACASGPPARLYQGPAPDAPGTARIRLEPLGVSAYFGTATQSRLHVYDTGDACPERALERDDPAYRGFVDASLLRGRLVVPAGGFVALAFEIDAVLPGRDRPWRCRVPFGFRPRDGAAYTLRLSIGGDERCWIDLYDDTGRRLAPVDPETCDAWWGAGEEAAATSP